MLYRRFGKSNLNLSIFSLGMMHCCHSESNLLEVVKKANLLGINHFETAKSYGKSQQYLGTALEKLQLKREKIVITTKFLPNYNYDQMWQNIEKSLSYLKVNYLDCVAIHGVNTWEHFQWIEDKNHGGMLAILEAKKQGKINHIGFSTHAKLELILATINTDLFDFINLHYYYFFQRNLPAIELAIKKDLGVFIISPADKGGRLYNPPEKLKNLSNVLSPLHFNYLFLLKNPSITTLSLGAAEAKELTYAVEIFESENNFNQLIKEIDFNLKKELSEQLTTDFCQQCYQCLPCPENINIPEILRLRNLTVALDMTEYGQYRYQMLENAGHWFDGKKGDKCTTCGDCLPRCPEKLNIPELLFDSHNRLNGKSRRRLWQ
jgi:predicted aldo/keto reductase-like oxidoreductase